MPNFAWWYYTLNSTSSLQFQWPWHDFKVTAVPNNCNWKFHVLIHISWNFVGLLSTWTSSWIYHYFIYFCICLREIIDMFPDLTKKKKIFGFFTNTSKFFKLCIIITLLGVYQLIPGLMTLTMLQGHRCVRVINCNSVWLLHTLKRSSTVCFV